ncbi:MAG: 50S ribosomal protein L25 [Patescibacteria group bacterium]|nr:50S ribosomal protein L25 [Patescibacteria group bacterium]MDE1946122.1 50S ribosomal protein L25 [Patescibacteria group bacterium]
MITLEVQKRDAKAGLGTIRKAGLMPAVFYGKKEKSTAIQLPSAIFEKTLKDAGESTILHLKGTGIDVDVLIHDVDLDPVTDKPRHADFYAIEKDKKLEIKVPLEFTGSSPAVKDLGAVLVKVMHEIEIEALPKDLPHKLDVDLSSLATFDSVIKVQDIKLPAGVTAKAKPEEIVASVYEPKEEVEAAPIDLSAIEVAKKGKEAKEGAEGAEAAAEAPKKEEKKEEKKK